MVSKVFTINFYLREQFRTNLLLSIPIFFQRLSFFSHRSFMHFINISATTSRHLASCGWINYLSYFLNCIDW